MSVEKNCNWEVLSTPGGGVLLKQIVRKKGRYEHKKGPRQVRMKVGSWKHIALDRLARVYPEGLNRNQVIPPFALTFSAKPLEELLRYGLIEHILHDEYWINHDGLKVLKELNEVKKIDTSVESCDEFNSWKRWAKILGKQLETHEYEICKGYKMVMVEIPGNTEWEKHFSTRTW